MRNISPSANPFGPDVHDKVPAHWFRLAIYFAIRFRHPILQKRNLSWLCRFDLRTFGRALIARPNYVFGILFCAQCKRWLRKEIITTVERVIGDSPRRSKLHSPTSCSDVFPLSLGLLSRCRYGKTQKL